jgi:hypothetical protein
MELHKKASLFKRLLGTIEVFVKEYNLNLTSKEVEALSLEFKVFLEHFFKRLRKRQ